ncbi:hypothetical protein AgCh_003742 [Apium graveolens]
MELFADIAPKTAENFRLYLQRSKEINAQGVEPDFPGPGPEYDPGCGAGDDNVVVGILKLAKSLPENRTLGEVLRLYEGKLGKTECVKGLLFIGEDKGLVLSC